MPIKINGSTSGSVTLAAPATGSDVTLTLPTLGFGKVLQVVYASYSTGTINATTSYADTGLSGTITPSSTSSKVLIAVAQAGVFKEQGNAGQGVDLKLLRGSTDLVVFAQYAGYTNSSIRNVVCCSCFYLDSPATTSATTYKTQFAAKVATAGAASVQAYGDTSTMILIEVGP